MSHQQSPFMSQIEAAKKEAQRLRDTMKDAARIATLTFPSTKHSAASATEQHSGKHKS